jgi:hypothetical protein
MIFTEIPLIDWVVSGRDPGQVISFQVDVVFIVVSVVQRRPG